MDIFRQILVKPDAQEHQGACGAEIMFLFHYLQHQLFVPNSRITDFVCLQSIYRPVCLGKFRYNFVGRWSHVPT